MYQRYVLHIGTWMLHLDEMNRQEKMMKKGHFNKILCFNCLKIESFTSQNNLYLMEFCNNLDRKNGKFFFSFKLEK